MGETAGMPPFLTERGGAALAEGGAGENRQGGGESGRFPPLFFSGERGATPERKGGLPRRREERKPAKWGAAVAPSLLLTGDVGGDLAGENGEAEAAMAAPAFWDWGRAPPGEEKTGRETAAAAIRPFLPPAHGEGEG